MTGHRRLWRSVRHLLQLSDWFKHPCLAILLNYDPVAWEHIFTTVLKIKLRSLHVAAVDHSWISQPQQQDRRASCDWIADNIEISVWLPYFVSCENAERGAVTITQTNYSKLLTTKAHMTLLSYTHTLVEVRRAALASKINTFSHTLPMTFKGKQRCSCVSHCSTLCTFIHTHTPFITCLELPTNTTCVRSCVCALRGANRNRGKPYQPAKSKFSTDESSMSQDPRKWTLAAWRESVSQVPTKRHSSRFDLRVEWNNRVPFFFFIKEKYTQKSKDNTYSWSHFSDSAFYKTYNQFIKQRIRS